MHIVIFTGGSCPEPEVTAAYFSSCKPDYVIAADSGLESLDKYQSFFSEIDFYPHEILGDMDSISGASLLEKYSNVKTERFIEDKDYTDTELALFHAYEKLKSLSGENGKVVFRDHRITLVGAGGTERLDHLLGVFDLFATELRPHVWVSGSQAAYYVRENETVYVENMGERENLSVARLSSGRTGGEIKSEGLLWESDCFRREGLPSISNRLSPEFIQQNKAAKLQIQEGEFLLIVSAHASVSITGPFQEG